MIASMTLRVAAVLVTGALVRGLPASVQGQASGGPGAAQDASSRPVGQITFPGPDFSFAGRDSRAAQPPPVSRVSHEYFDVTEYGALANDGVSDREAIEAAITAAESHPGPAVVWFPAGRFVLRDVDDVGAPALRIRRSDLVLKGTGMYSGGTELFIESESNEAFAVRFWPELDPRVGWRGAATLSALSQIPERGQREVAVEDVSRLQVGDVVRLSGVLPDTFHEFRAFFAPLGDDELIQGYFDRSSGAGADWRSDFLSTLQIESVGSDSVRFKEPLQADYAFVSPTYVGGPKLVQIFATGDAFLTDVGVEDLAFVSNYRDNFKHFFNRAADGYNFVEMRDVRESWVRRVRMRSGTRGIVFSANGKSNVVYDVVFEGNSGHYSITTDGNSYGNQASFLREEVPVHHGFGATSSAFSTVYHRCNQFGGPEGHGGYPQATLYDNNEGDLSLPRLGGAPPHQSKFSVFWNWRQSLLIPSNSGLRGGSGRFRATSLNGASIDFWPDRIMRPYVIGLRGVPLTVHDAKTDLAPLQHLDGAVMPESLFEAQLRDRLGATPVWLRQRAASFEAITRYTQVDIGAPPDDSSLAEGQSLVVQARLHPDFDRHHLQRLELRVARGHDLDFDEKTVVTSSSTDVEALSWRPTAAGPWRFRLVLVNSLGEESSSEPLYVFVEPAGKPAELLEASDAWLQPRSLDGREIMEASADVVFQTRDQYHQAVRAIERPLVEMAVDDAVNRVVGLGLIDGLLGPDATSAAALRYYGNKGLVFDLGSTQRIDFIELVGAPGAADRDYFGAFDVQVSSADEAQYSYTNSDFTWRTVRRMGHALSSAKMPMNSQRRHRIHFPLQTEARFVRLAIRILDSQGTTNGNLSEVLFGRYPAR